MIKLFKVVQNIHRNKFLVEWNKPNDELEIGWNGLSNFVLVCEKVKAYGVFRETNIISKGDVMQEFDGTDKDLYFYNDNPDNKWRVIAVCDYEYEIDFALIAYADGQTKRLEIKQTLMERGTN